MKQILNAGLWIKVSSILGQLSTFRGIGLILGVIFQSACMWHQASEQPDYSLERVTLTIQPEHQGRMKSALFAKTDVPGEVVLDGTRFPVMLSFSGRSSILNLKKSYTLHFSQGRRYAGHRTYKLNGQAADPTLLRSQIAADIFRAEGFAVSAMRPVTLYVNQEYQGVYLLIEPVNEDFFSLRGIPLSALYKAILAQASLAAPTLTNLEKGFDVEVGPDDLTAIRALALAVNQVGEGENYDVEKMMDIPQYIRYMGVALLVNHWDGFDNNYYLYKKAYAEPFRIVPWDMDKTFGKTAFREIMEFSSANVLATYLLQQPKWKAEYRVYVETLLAKYSAEWFAEEVKRRATLLRSAVEHDPYVKRSVAYDSIVDGLIDDFREWHQQISDAVTHY